MYRFKYAQKLNTSGSCKRFVRYKGQHVVMQQPDNQISKVTGHFVLIRIIRVSSPRADYSSNS